MAADYKVPEKFDDFLYVSHLLQAEGINSAMLAHRKNKPYCMGTLYWQLNDCWPVASWSSTDYYRNYKAVHYFARKAYEPVIVIASSNEDKSEFRIVSDSREKLAGTLKITAMTFAGKVLHEESVAATVDPLGNLVAATYPTNTLTTGHPAGEVVIRAEFTSGSDVTASTLLYLVKPKDMLLAKPQVRLTVTDAGSDWAITLTSDKLAKNVMVTWKGRAGIFSDNYFDVLPGKSATIRISKALTPTDPSRELATRSLVDTLTR
jgi:beta-mannosidase